jgi:hypothetical protein
LLLCTFQQQFIFNELLFSSTNQQQRKRKKKEKISSLLICTLQEQKNKFNDFLLFVEEKKHVKKKPFSKAIGDDGKGSIVIGVRSTKRWDWPKKFFVDNRVGVGCSPIIFCQNTMDGLMRYCTRDVPRLIIGLYEACVN